MKAGAKAADRQMQTLFLGHLRVGEDLAQTLAFGGIMTRDQNMITR